MPVTGRLLFVLAALLLLATAGLHAMGEAMLDRWLAGLGERERSGIALMWLGASVSWTVVALIWLVAAWRRERGWLGASALAGLTPLSMAAGVLRIDPGFFGGWMLAGSVCLAAAGLLFSRRRTAVEGGS
jgi:hypothetical protein